MRRESPRKSLDLLRYLASFGGFARPNGEIPCSFPVFSGHAVYFPELFPTQIRSTGVAFCNGAARIITSFGPLIAGLLAAALGGFSVAAAIMVCFALLSVVAMLIGRETKGRELPH